jgi:hypothetical protein
MMREARSSPYLMEAINGHSRFSKSHGFIWRMINLERLIIRQANGGGRVSFLSLRPRAGARGQLTNRATH